MMNDSRHSEDFNRIVGAWLDRDDGTATVGSELHSFRSTEEAAQREIADLLLVDALLQNLSQADAQRREKRIRKVMEVVGQVTPQRRPHHNATRWVALAAAAAVLLIAAALVFIRTARTTLANEVLLAVNKASAVSTDRVYSICRLTPASDDGELPRGTLYLRGREGLVITWGDVVLGRSGGEFWLVSHGQHVTLSEDFGWIDSRGTNDRFGINVLQELSIQSRHVPLMQLASVAELMQHDYAVTLQQTTHNGRPVDLLLGVRGATATGLPRSIRLWADPETRVILRAELSWQPGNSILLELNPDTPVPAQWYSYLTHCGDEPTVRRIPSESR